MLSLSGLSRLATLSALAVTAPILLVAQGSSDSKSTTPLRAIGQPTKQLPHVLQQGSDLPNGWRITPAGKPVAELNDLVLNMVVSKDGRIVVATHSGYLPHGIDVFDVKTGKRLWIFHTIPKPGEFGYNTWENDSADYTGNTGVWGQISVDESSGWSTCRWKCRRAITTAAIVRATAYSAKASWPWI